jgi:hypothetical protein
MFEILLPFVIQIDPMDRLLLVNFEKDPDSVYVGFEPQVFDDAVNGRGHLVIGWRVDGRVDVYHQPSLHLDRAKYDIAGKGLANMVEVDMPSAYYEINDRGVQASYAFRDMGGRDIVLKIAERSRKTRKPFGLLAPMGDAAEHPSAMPLVFLHDFYFVRKHHTDVEVSINGRKHQLDVLPLPMDCTKMYFTRYSPKPLIATFNPAFDGTLPSAKIEPGATQYSEGGYTYEFEWLEQQPHLKSCIRHTDHAPIRLSFQPAFPSVDNLPSDAEQSGIFTIAGHPSAGSIGGEYQVSKKDGKILISVAPTGGWKPRPTKLSLRFLYAVAKVFTRWPTTYVWTAELEPADGGAWTMRSNWKRTGRIL